MFPISAGKSVKPLTLRLSVLMLGNVVRMFGTTPVKSLFDRSSVVTDDRLAIPFGIVVKSFADKFKTRTLERPPIASGIVPVKLLLLK